MAPAASDIEIFGSNVRPVDDTTANIGGPIDASGQAGAPGARPFSAHITGSPTKVTFRSDGADTRSVDVEGRLATGAIVNETVVLNGAADVDTVNTYERLLDVAPQTISTTRTITFEREDNAGALGTIPPNEKRRFCMFKRSASAAGATNREEKLFVRNKGADAGVDAYVKLTSDPLAADGGALKIGVPASKGDSATIANRLGTFGVTLYDDGVTVPIPTTVLGANENCGIIVQEGLAAGHDPVKDTFTIEAGCTSIT